MNRMKVGIFFIVSGRLVMDAVPTSEGEPYGKAIQYGGHYDFWEKLVPKSPEEKKLKARAYDAYPRGRVIFFPDTEKNCVYADKCLDGALAIVTERFELQNAEVEFRHDEHYKCSQCNPGFMD